MNTVCDGCKVLVDKGKFVCEKCTAYPGCEDCEDSTYCNECINDHLKTCSKKSRATRSLSVANRGNVITLTQEIASAKDHLKQLEATLAQAKARKIKYHLKQLKATLAKAKARKIEAEAELKAEGEAS
jgi:hypothetical protein